MDHHIIETTHDLIINTTRPRANSLSNTTSINKKYLNEIINLNGIVGVLYHRNRLMYHIQVKKIFYPQASTYYRFFRVRVWTTSPEESSE